MKSAASQANTDTTPEVSTSYVPYSRRPYIITEKKDYKTPLLFLLSYSLWGLQFYPALIFMIIIMIRAYRDNKYNFVLMFTIFAGSYGFAKESMIPVRFADVALLASLILFVIYRKPPIVRKTIMVYLAYVAATVALAMCSIESLRVQLFMMRTYWGFAIFIIPIITFSHERFNINVFFSRTLVFVMLISIFYILDAVIFCGNFLIPYANPWGETSTFYRPDIHPLSFHVFRKYPYGMYLLVLLVVPLARNMRIKLWQAATIAAALLCTQTFTIISGFILAFAIFQGKTKRLLAMLTLLPVLFMALYFVDSILPVRKSEHFQSTLRIKSSVDQFADLFQAVDDEDLAQFASGRMAQILPKVDIIVRNHKEMTGLGFLHPDKTKITQYIITNEYYSDVSENEEVAAVVEVVPVQIFISMGYIGLAVHILFLVFLYLIIRKLKYSVYFLSMIFCSFWFGLGGFCGLHSAHGLFLAALTYSVVILVNRESLPGFRLPPVKARIQNAIP